MRKSADFQRDLANQISDLHADIRKNNNAFEQQQRKIFEKILDLEERMDVISRQPYLPAIPKPSQKESGRSPNITGILRKWIAEKNKNLMNSKKYLQFPDDVSDIVLNTAAKQCLQGYMALHLSGGWEEKSWSEIYAFSRGAAEQVVQSTSRDRTMLVYSQCAAQWSIRMMAEQKQRSNQRAKKMQMSKKEELEISFNRGPTRVNLETAQHQITEKGHPGSTKAMLTASQFREMVIQPGRNSPINNMNVPRREGRKFVKYTVPLSDIAEGYSASPPSGILRNKHEKFNTGHPKESGTRVSGGLPQPFRLKYREQAPNNSFENQQSSLVDGGIYEDDLDEIQPKSPIPVRGLPIEADDNEIHYAPIYNEEQPDSNPEGRLYRSGIGSRKRRLPYDWYRCTAPKDR